MWAGYAIETQTHRPVLFFTEQTQHTSELWISVVDTCGVINSAAGILASIIKSTGL